MKKNIKNICNDTDIELKLLCGMPIEIDSVGFIHSLTLKQITKIGYSIYNSYVDNLCFDMKDIKIDLSEMDGFEDISPFDIIYAQCLMVEDDKQNLYKKLILDGLSLFFNEEVKIFIEKGLFYLGELEDKRFINQDNYEQIKKIIKLQNCVQDKAEEEEYNPANERARQLIEQIKENRKNAPKVKQSTTLQSIISGVAWKSHVGIYFVWDLTIYQLYDAYYRLLVIDNYSNTYSGIYAGTIEAKKINLKDLSWVKTI